MSISGAWTYNDCIREIGDLIASAEHNLDEKDVIEVLVSIHDLVTEKMLEHGVDWEHLEI